MKYLKKAIPVDAWQIDMLEIDNDGNYPDWVRDAWVKKIITHGHRIRSLQIITLEGAMTADEGDYLIKGPKGEYWFNKKDIFESMYEEWDGSYEYDTGRPIPGAAKKTNHIEVTKVTDLPDGGANYEFDLSDDIRDALIRIALKSAIEKMVENEDTWKPKDPDEQPETLPCDWADEDVKCDDCACWKNIG